MTSYAEESEVSIRVSPDGVVEVRVDTVTLGDGREIARAPHRVALAPGDDVNDQSERVRAICGAVWTPDVVTAWRDRISPRRAD